MSRKPTLVIASRNRKKCEEIAEILARYGIESTSLAEWPDLPKVVEDGSTFAENAAKKAGQTAEALSRWTLGEDSGLTVDALDGAPGIYSARFSGEDATDEENNRQLIAELGGVLQEKRTAAYVCSAAVADPAGQIVLQVEGTCRGQIVSEPRGSNGFGYDPHFLIPEYHRTFGELAPVVKRHLSHRARAIGRLAPELAALLERDEAAD